MKKIFFITVVSVMLTNSSYAQRYLENIFTAVDSITNISYGNAVDYLHTPQDLLVDFYEPHNDHFKKRPLIIYVHGGGFQGGTRKWPSIRKICEKLALKGYVVASIDYRVDPTFKVTLNSTYANLLPDTNRRAMTDAMHDLKAAIRFFKANKRQYRIDTANIIVGGESAGAIASMMATYINKPKELRSYPKANPDNIEGTSGNPGYGSKPKAVLCLCGVLPDTSAIESPKDPTFLWIHGSKDPMLPIAWAENILTRAHNIGLPHQQYVFEGATHCPWYFGLPDWQGYLDKTVTYIAQFVYPLVSGGKK